jgi:hypothetical protein
VLVELVSYGGERPPIAQLAGDLALSLFDLCIPLLHM